MPPRRTQKQQAGLLKAVHPPSQGCAPKPPPSSRAREGEVAPEEWLAQGLRPNGYGENNKIFTKERADHAREILRRKFSEPESGSSSRKHEVSIWAPTPHGQAWRCGMIRVWLGTELTPEVHQSLIAERVQEPTDLVGSKQAARLVADLAVDVQDALLPAVPRHDEMGECLVLGLIDNLRNRGALVTNPLVVRRAPNVSQEEWDEMTFWTWLAYAS